MTEKYDVEKIVGDLEKAILAGKYRHAMEKESEELRLAAFENILASCKKPSIEVECALKGIL